MGTPDVLFSSVQHTHDDLAARLAGVRAMAPTPGEPRKPLEGIDTFLAVASQHLGAVDAVLLPPAHKRLSEGTQVVHDYLHAARHLEVMLAHVKARAYGSTFEAGHHWSNVWDDVEGALLAQRRRETDLVAQLSAVLRPAELDDLAGRLHRARSSSPTRPHPYTPHTGLPGLVARRILHLVDSFWDTAEGRMSPAPRRQPHGRPGLLAQYLLADPRFDEADTRAPRTRRHG